MRSDKNLGQKRLAVDKNRESHLKKYRPVWEEIFKLGLMEIRCVCVCVCVWDSFIFFRIRQSETDGCVYGYASPIHNLLVN